MVRFVVEQIPAPPATEHQVDEALEHPLHGGKTERLAAPRQRVVLLAEGGQRRCRHPPHGQEELQPTCLRSGPDPAAAPAPQSRSPGGIQHRLHLLLQHGAQPRRTILGQQGGDVLALPAARPACLKSMVSNRLWSRCRDAPLGEGEMEGAGPPLPAPVQPPRSPPVIKPGLASTPLLCRCPGPPARVGADPPVPLKLPWNAAHLGSPSSSSSAAAGPGG